jgi:uncharacterized repeat protein (TIGR03803 family)
MAAISASDKTMPLGYWPFSSWQRTVRPVLVVVRGPRSAVSEDATNLRISGLFTIATLCCCAGQSLPAELTTLVNFDGTNGGFPAASLIADANGNLFGTTPEDGAYGYGTVFEIPNTAASTPTILVNFNGADGSLSTAGLIADANGNLFGTAETGGANGQGTVIEIAKTASGYASTPTVLASFNRTNGAIPAAGLLADGNGNLFGTTSEGGTYGYGTVFQIAKTARGYASTPPRWSTLAALTVAPQSPA